MTSNHNYVVSSNTKLSAHSSTSVDDQATTNYFFDIELIESLFKMITNLEINFQSV